MNKFLLLALLLGSALSASAGTFYLLSAERRSLTDPHRLSPPLPFNSRPELNKHWIVDDVWLVEDEKTTTEEVETLGLLLAARIDRAREAARTQAVRDSLNRALSPPPRPPHSNDHNRTTTNLTAAGLAALERIHPGISTNFTPEQLERARRNAKPVISRPAGPGDVIPLDPHSPTFKEDFGRWKNGTLTNVPTSK